MTAKIEAGIGWMCTIHDAQTIRSEMPVTEMEQPIAVSYKDKFGKVSLTQKAVPIVNVNPWDFHTEVTIATDIDSGAEESLGDLVATGIVQQIIPKLGGEGAAFVALTEYLLSGKLSTIEFGQKGKPDYLKVTHEMEQRGKLVSG
jgi:hypothetical protein